MSTGPSKVQSKYYAFLCLQRNRVSCDVGWTSSAVSFRFWMVAQALLECPATKMGVNYRALD